MAKRSIQHPQARWRVIRPSSSGEHQHRRKAKWAEITCKVHGRQMVGATWKLPQVVVALPKNKRDRITECPFCLQERLIKGGVK